MRIAILGAGQVGATLGRRFAEALEHAAALWIQLASQGGLGRDFAFVVARR